MFWDAMMITGIVFLSVDALCLIICCLVWVLDIIDDSRQIKRMKQLLREDYEVEQLEALWDREAA